MYYLASALAGNGGLRGAPFASGCCALPHCRKTSVLSGLTLGGLPPCTARPLSLPLPSGGAACLTLLFQRYLNQESAKLESLSLDFWETPHGPGNSTPQNEDYLRGNHLSNATCQMLRFISFAN